MSLWPATGFWPKPEAVEWEGLSIEDGVMGAVDQRNVVSILLRGSRAEGSHGSSVGRLRC